MQQMPGAGPPANVEPADLWAKLTTLPRPTQDVPFPRRHPVTKEWMQDKLSVQVLTEAELMSARAAADIYAKDLLKDVQRSGDANLGYQDIYRNALVVEVIVRAYRSPNMPGKPPAFPSSQQARKFLTADEFAVLFQAYCTFQAESGPILSSMTPEEMNAWLDRLAEGASSVPLAALSSDAKNQLLLHSALLLRKSRTGNGSPGSPPSESSTETTSETTEAANETDSVSPRPALSSRVKSLVDDAERPPPLTRDE